MIKYLKALILSGISVLVRSLQAVFQLSFGDVIAKSKRSPKKLFVLLEMYEIMRELHSEV